MKPAIFLLLLALSAFAGSPLPRPATTPWDVKALERVPGVAWVDESSPIHARFYEGEIYEGRKTGVFAYYASPATLGIDTTPGKNSLGWCLCMAAAETRSSRG